MKKTRRFEARETRFSSKVLRAYAATGLPQALGVRAAAEGAPTEILLYDEIGYWGVTAKDFVLALAAAGPGPIHLRINSPGGDAFDGLAIYNALRARTAPVMVTVDGIAASAASFIAMAGKPMRMPPQAMLMVHNCWGLCIGNRNDMLEMAAVQEKIDGQMAEIYAAKTGKPKAQLTGVMDAETWYTSSEAKAFGLADEILPEAEKAAALASASIIAPRSRLVADIRPGAALPTYDPDGDGDNDAEEALGFVNSAMALLEAAADALTGEDDDAEETEEAGAPATPIVPGARRTRRARAAASPAEWIVGAAEDLPIDAEGSWDGPAAAERMLDDAGFNGTSPDPAKARRGFLAYDHHNPKLKGSYKLPFADLKDGKLTALKSGIDAAASRLPDTDIPDDVKTKARAVIDKYEARMKPKDRSGLDLRARRARLAAADNLA